MTREMIALSVDEELILRACSFTLSLASRNEGLVAEVERDRTEVKVRGAQGLRNLSAGNHRDMIGFKRWKENRENLDDIDHLYRI
jgi:hypothetical protein